MRPGADDPQVAVHAVRNLARIAFGRAALRWSQLGFGRTSSTSTSQATPRNLMGFKDGTMNVKAEDPAAVDDACLGADRCGQQGEMAGRWLVSGGAPYQHDHRDLGPAAAERAGAGHWPDKGRGCAANGRRRVQPA